LPSAEPELMIRVSPRPRVFRREPSASVRGRCEKLADASASASAHLWCIDGICEHSPIPVLTRLQGTCIVTSFYRASVLHRAIDKGNPFVCPSVCHTRKPRLNGSRHLNIFIRHDKSGVSSFVRLNFTVSSLGVHPKQ